jgi:hypothetical protein
MCVCLQASKKQPLLLLLLHTCYALYNSAAEAFPDVHMYTKGTAQHVCLHAMPPPVSR